MFKTFRVKNTDLREEMSNKWITRVQADAIIAKDRFVEKDATSGDIEAGEINSVRVIGVNPDTARAADDFFNCEIGRVEVVAGTPIVAGQKVKCGTGGKAISFIDSALINAEIATFDGAGFTNQPATDGVTAVSTSALDITQTLTVHGIDAGGAYETEELVITGTTDVDSTTVDWDVIVAVELDAACVGDIELSETSVGAEIITLTAGTTSAGIETISDGYSYNKAPTAVADGASTGKIVFTKEATDGATATTEIVTLNGTTEVAFAAANYKVTTAYTGNVADTVNVDVDVTATEDDEQLAIGRAVVGASAGSNATIVM